VAGHSGNLRDDGGVLTSGKHSGQEICIPQGSGLLTGLSGDLLSLRWAALLIYVLPNLDGCIDQLQKVLLLDGS
jgi:hypothetical protein